MSKEIYVFEGKKFVPLYACDNCGKALGEIACSNSKGGSYCSARCADADEPKTCVEDDPNDRILELIANLSMKIAELERKVGIIDEYNDELLDFRNKLKEALRDE